MLVTTGVALLVFVAALSRWHTILGWAARSTRDGRPYRLDFLMTSPTNAYHVQLGVAVDITVLAILPLLAYQLVVADFPQIRRGGAMAVGLTTAACFAGGAVFGWYVIFPPALDHLMRSQAAFSVTVSMYLGLASLTVFAAAIACSLPAVYTLASMHLASARWIVWSWAAATAAIALASRLDGAPRWPLFAEVGGLLLLCYIAWMLLRLAHHAHRPR
jgi:Sec-independent protein secretion pathway component TatC